MVVYGIDFTSAPTDKKPLTQSVCYLSGDVLAVERIKRLRTFEELERLLNQPAPWIAALDFPFGQPRRLIENLKWPQPWREYTRVVGSMTKREFEDCLRRYQHGRPKGEKRHFRAVDVLAGSCSPMQLDFIPVAKMFYEGAKRLLYSNATVVPFESRGSNAGVVVEGYPALVARRWIGRSGKYKNDDRKKWTPEMRDNRRTLVERIQRSGPPWAYDCRVCLDPATARDCVEDGSGDQLDAVFCAMQAAWAFKRGSGGYGVPASCDLLEGWIVDPFARMRFGRASSVGSGSRS